MTVMIMSNSSKRAVDKGTQAEQRLVIVETDSLKQRLNRAFIDLHGGSKKRVEHDVNFDRLWDIKESAILEGKSSVELPGQWLAELEEMSQIKSC